MVWLIIGPINKTEKNEEAKTMQAFGAYASASVDLAAFAPRRRPQQSEPRPKRESRARALLRSLGQTLVQLAGEPTNPAIPRLEGYPY